MKTSGLLLSLAAITLALGSIESRAQSVPSLMNYQGRLTDSAGLPLPAGNYRVAFRFWNKQALDVGQQLVWGREHDVTISEGGAFSVILGSGGQAVTNVPPPAVNDLAYAFGQSNRFIGLTITRDRNAQAVANPSEIFPRQQILSSPFAIKAQEAEQAQLSSALIPSLANALCPPGSVMAFAGNDVPAGWLLCDGSAVSRTTYSNLWTAIGFLWGVGDGSTTFHLPDLRGYFLRGVDGSPFGRDPDKNSRTTSNTGGSAGAAVGSVQSDAFQSHNHKVYGPAPGGSLISSTRFSLSAADYAAVNQSFARDAGANPDEYAADELPPARTSAESRPKNAYVNYIIKY